MLKELKGLIGKVKNSYLRKLLDAFFKETGFVDAFCKAPAAKSVHHAYLGGLLEHTLSVTRLATLIARNYPELNVDILITGAVLHDIGKTTELSVDVGFDYTDSGRLLGHIVTGTLMLDKKISEIKGFPTNLADTLKHIIVSHHGMYEWGSPKRPKTMEALALHYADDMDAKLMIIKSAMQRELGSAQSGWTGYNSLMGRYFFKGSDVCDDAQGAPPRKKERKSSENAAGLNQFDMFEDRR